MAKKEHVEGAESTNTHEEKVEQVGQDTAEQVGQDVPKEAEPKKKRKGSGITRETKGTTLKKIVPVESVNNGLVVTRMVNVSCTMPVWEKADADGYRLFKGKEVPKLTFVFEQVAVIGGQSTGTYIHSFNAVPMGSEDWKYRQIFDYVKHFIDVLVPNSIDLDEYWEKLEDMLDLDIELTNVDEVLAEFANFFKNIVTVFKGSEELGLPSLLSEDLLWTKLLMYTMNKNKLVEVNNGDYGFPIFPGEGVIEKYIKDVAPSLRINIAKGESIVPKDKTAKAKSGVDIPTPGMPTTAPNGGNTGNSGMPGFLNS